MVAKKAVLLVALFALCLFPSLVLSVETAPRITDREIVEKLTRLEEGQKALSQRIDDTSRRLEEGQKALGQRIDDTNRRLEEGYKALGQRIDDTNRRIDELRQTLLWGLGVMFAGMFALVGFVIWDRRSALAPAVRQMERLREREEKLEAALKKYAHQVPELAEALKKMGLL